MKTEERTPDEAYNEFIRLSKLHKWVRWAYRYFQKPVFPICIRVDDSRQCSLQKDTDDDYLLRKHFVTVKEDSPGFYVITTFTTREPEGEQNEPYELEYEDSPYCWPVCSLRHAKKMIPDLIYTMNMNPNKD
jgi:hypothetical protein